MIGNFRVFIILMLCASLTGYADVLRLKGGNGVQGTLISANSSEIRFQTVSGSQKTFPLSDVAGIDFAPLPPPPAPPRAAAPAATARKVPAAASIVVPVGTEITARLIDSIQGSASGAGQRYNCTVDDPIVVGDQVVIPRGANCTIQVVALDNGKDVDLSLYDISIQGKSYHTASEYAVVKAEGTSKGKKAARRGIGLGAIGAGIGAIAGGGSGAAIGAAVGGGVGAISATASKGKQINVPSETRLAFKLKQPLPLN
jgi:hypothetical protein